MFGASEVSLRDIMRKEGSTDEQLLEVISQAVQRKKAKHAGIKCIVLVARVYNIYTEESILLSYTPVEGRIVKL